MVSVFLVGGILGYMIGLWSPGTVGAPSADGGEATLAEQQDTTGLSQDEKLFNAFQASSPVDVSEDGNPFIGDKDAPITVVEFSDYQCYYCRKFSSDTLPSIIQNYVDKGKVKLVYRDRVAFPNSKAAAQAAECAGKQDAYFLMHDVLFRETDWTSASDPTTLFVGYAANLDLDEEEFAACLQDPKVAQEIEDDNTNALEVGARGTPTFFINGKRLVGAQPYPLFSKIFDAMLKDL